VESWSAALVEEARIKSLPRRAKELLLATAVPSAVPETSVN
jgi:predicted GIY-YIG superfamily endonuclease